MKNTLRTHIGRSLNLFGMRRVVRRLEHAIRPRTFRADTDETPWAVERALKLVRANGLADRGDYYEFGIYRGYTLWHAQNFMRKAGNESMRFFGFDSFQGFPEVEGPDAYKGDFSRGQFTASYQYVRNTLTENGVDWKRTFLVPGFYDQTLNDKLKSELALRPAAVVLIDCVLYESTKLVLAFLKDLLTDGSMLVFDDWNAFDQQDDHGERRACREFLDANRHLRAVEAFDYGIYGKTYQLNINTSSSGDDLANGEVVRA